MSSFWKRFFLSVVTLCTMSCGGSVDIYLASGEPSCSKKPNADVVIVKSKPGSEFREIGRLSSRFSEMQYYKQTIQNMVEQSSRCGADILYLLSYKRIYNGIEMIAGEQKTGVYQPYFFEQKGIMYRHLQ